MQTLQLPVPVNQQAAPQTHRNAVVAYTPPGGGMPVPLNPIATYENLAAQGIVPRMSRAQQGYLEHFDGYGIGAFMGAMALGEAVARVTDDGNPYACPEHGPGCTGYHIPAGAHSTVSPADAAAAAEAAQGHLGACPQNLGQCSGLGACQRQQYGLGAGGCSAGHRSLGALPGIKGMMRRLASSQRAWATRIWNAAKQLGHPTKNADALAMIYATGGATPTQAIRLAVLTSRKRKIPSKFKRLAGAPMDYEMIGAANPLDLVAKAVSMWSDPELRSKASRIFRRFKQHPWDAMKAMGRGLWKKLVGNMGPIPGAKPLGPDFMLLAHEVGNRHRNTQGLANLIQGGYLPPGVRGEQQFGAFSFRTLASRLRNLRTVTQRLRPVLVSPAAKQIVRTVERGTRTVATAADRMRAIRNAQAELRRKSARARAALARDVRPQVQAAVRSAMATMAAAQPKLDEKLDAVKRELKEAIAALQRDKEDLRPILEEIRQQRGGALTRDDLRSTIALELARAGALAGKAEAVSIEKYTQIVRENSDYQAKVKELEQALVAMKAAISNQKMIRSAFAKKLDEKRLALDRASERLERAERSEYQTNVVDAGREAARRQMEETKRRAAGELRRVKDSAGQRMLSLKQQQDRAIAAAAEQINKSGIGLLFDFVGRIVTAMKDLKDVSIGKELLEFMPGFARSMKDMQIDPQKRVMVDVDVYPPGAEPRAEIEVSREATV